MMPTFDDVLPRLSALHQQGRLVPFVGSGMSAGACASWAGFVEGLETQAKIDPDEQETTTPALIRRAERAVRLLKGNGTDLFAQAIKRALAEKKSDTAQTTALMKLPWPLIVSTNYDDVLLRQADANTVVCGRSPLHCQRVIASRGTVDSPILWLVQGYAGAHGLVSEDCRQELNGQLVVGHREYCEVTFLEPVFRRAFAHVYANSSLLFLGSGLAEDYIQNLFSEIVATFGLPRTPHFALMHQDQARRSSSFLARNLGVVTCSYSDHDQLPAMLRRLSAAVQAPGRLRSLQFSCPYFGVDHHVEIAARRLRIPSAKTECVAVSAGYSQRSDGGFDVWLGEQGNAIQAELQLRGVTLAPPRTPTPDPAAHVYDMGKSVYAVVARRPHERDVRDLRTVATAMAALVRRAYSDGYRSLEVGLLAVNGQSRWQPAYSAIEMLRGVRQVLAAKDLSEPMRITICIVDQNVVAKIWNGGIDVSSLLASSAMDSWVIVGEDKPGNRVRVMCDESDTVQSIAAELDVRDEWEFVVHPVPAQHEPVRRLTKDGQRTLAEIGIVPGGTLHFRRNEKDVADLSPVPRKGKKVKKSSD